MKHFILSTLLVFLISNTIYAQSNLVVYSNDGVKFTLEVNGVQQNSEPSTNVKVEGITQEYISTRILFAEGNIPHLKKSFPLTPNNEVSAQIIQNKKGQWKLRYMGETPISSSAAPSNQSVIRYGEEPVSDSQNSAENTSSSTTTTTTTISSGNSPETESVNMNVNIGGQNIGISTSVTGMESSSSTNNIHRNDYNNEQY